MKKLAMTVLIVLVSGVAVATYMRSRAASTTSQEPAMLELQARTSERPQLNADRPILNASHQEAPPPPPPPLPPPPFPGTPHIRPSPPEPARSLIGIGVEDLKDIGRYLPKGAQVYTYPVGETSLGAAIISADLDGDLRDETVLAYNERKPTLEEGTLPLTLGVLVREGNQLKMRASTQMLGGVLFDVSMNGFRTHLAVHDVTGDGRREIVIVPATGASIGGWLEVYSLERSTLRKLARIGGHFFQLRTKDPGKPGLITARWNGEKETRTYEWNGREFEEIRKRVKKSQ